MEFLLFLIPIVLFLMPIVAMIIYIIKTNTLSAKVEKLEREIYQIRGTVNAMKPVVESPPAPAIATPSQKVQSETPQVSPIPISATVTPPVSPAAVPSLTPVTSEPAEITEPTEPISQPPLTSAPPTQPSRSKAELEALIGGKLLNRIGALALIIGVGFFLKHAFDNNWLTETMRVFIGIVIGAGLLLGGWRSHKRGFLIFAQGLVGAGISILYVSVYASFNFYHLVPQLMAFALMSAVTILTFLQAFKYNSLAVSLLGWAGGFLTPFLLSTGQANEAGLFTYILLLDIGLLAVLVKKSSWIILEPLTLGATYLIYLLWYQQYYTPDKLLLTVLFLSIFWGLFYALDVLRLIRPITTFPEIRQVVSAFNAFFYYLGMHAIIDRQYPDWMGLVTLLIGSIYFLTALAAKRRQPGIPIYAQSTLTAIVFLILATWIQFSGYTTVICWSLEALILVWCGLHWKLRYVWQVVLSLFVFATIKLLFTQGALSYSPIKSFTLLLNQRALAFSVVAATLGAGAVFFKRLGEMDERTRELIQSWLHYGWCIIIFALCTVEANDYFRAGTFAGDLFVRFLTLASTWLVYSFPLVWYGLRKKILPLFYCGLGALVLAICLAAIQGFSFKPIEKFTMVLNFRTAVFLFIIVGACIHGRWLRNSRQTYDWIDKVFSVFRVVMVLLILDLITGETQDFFEKAILLLKQEASSSDISSKLKGLTNLQQLSLSGVWLVYSIILMLIGIWRRLQWLRLVSIVLFGVSILKIFIYDLSFLDTLYRIFSFIGLGLILLAVSYLYHRYKAVIFDVSASNNLE